MQGITKCSHHLFPQHCLDFGMNRPFLSFKTSHFENEAKCKIFVVKISSVRHDYKKMIFISMASWLASL